MSAEKLKFARFNHKTDMKIHIGQLRRPGLTLVLVLAALPAAFAQVVDTVKTADKPLPPVVRSFIGDYVQSADGAISLRNATKRQQFNGSQKSTFDRDIASPKSAGFHPDGSRLYVNSLEGCATVVYDARTMRKLKVISHRFEPAADTRWATPSGFYPWTHYADGARRPFSGKPVEMAFSHRGRYLWVPYYRRSFDINAQDPSAVAVIDTRTDSIVRMFETGPLPKMVATSNGGDLLAITHWGDNTVGLIDISGQRPDTWRHLQPIVIGKKLQLDFPLDRSVDRDSKSGLLLRGTIFTPGDRHMLIGCMGGSIAVVDVARRRHTGFINDIYNVRHLALRGNRVYASQNVAGKIWSIAADSLTSAIDRAAEAGRRAISANGWRGCQVGKGARTLEVSPDGRYTFVACNFDSRVDVVDNETMKVVTSIRCDSYPVGLALSRRGGTLAVTSQGRRGQGGNALNLFNIHRK